MITLSMTARSISGMETVMSVVPIDTPNGANLRLWREGGQPPPAHLLSCLIAHAPDRASGAGPEFGSAFARGWSALDEARSPGEDPVEPFSHLLGGLGGARRR